MKKGKYFFLLCPHSEAIMVKGWILDLPIIPQPIVFLCIVLAAQPTLSWSLSDLDQWAHFSQYLGLCQQKLHILILAMCCKRQKSKMKRFFYLTLKDMKALKLLNEHGDGDPNIADWNKWRHSSYWMTTEPGGHARLTQPSPSGQFRWLAMQWWRMQKDRTALLPRNSFTMHPVVDDQLTMASLS